MIKSIGKRYYRVKGFYPVTINGLRFKCDPFHIGFWRLVNKGKFEPQFYQILNTHLDQNSIYCDIGSWIGPTAIYASKLCKKVYCFEPDDIAFQYLEQNIQMNTLNNVIPYKLAVGVNNGQIKIASHGGNLGDSMTSMVNVDQYETAVYAESIKWQTWIDKYQPEKIDFLKMDIEGGEFEVIPTMIDYFINQKPILSLSTHCKYISEEFRKEKMEKLVDVLNFYTKCFNENLEPVLFDKNIIASCLNSFRSFLFLP